MKRRRTTNPKIIVRDILSIRNVNAPGIQFAKNNAQAAIDIFKGAMALNVQRSGLYIDTDNPYLAATPNGKVFS